MAHGQPTTTSQARPRGRRIPSLEGVNGRLRIEVPGAPSRTVEVRDGTAETVEARDPVDATIKCENEADCQALLSGELNPVVAALQGRLQTSGDATFAARVLLGLPAEAKAGSAPKGE
jgi:putative sterol carrier protein